MATGNKDISNLGPHFFSAELDEYLDEQDKLALNNNKPDSDGIQVTSKETCDEKVVKISIKSDLPNLTVTRKRETALGQGKAKSSKSVVEPKAGHSESVSILKSGKARTKVSPKVEEHVADLQCEDKILLAAIYPNVPSDAKVQIALENMRRDQTTIDERWARFAASAIYDRSEKSERFLLPIRVPCLTSTQRDKTEISPVIHESKSEGPAGSPAEDLNSNHAKKESPRNKLSEPGTSPKPIAAVPDTRTSKREISKSLSCEDSEDKALTPLQPGASVLKRSRLIEPSAGSCPQPSQPTIEKRRVYKTCDQLRRLFIDEAIDVFFREGKSKRVNIFFNYRDTPTVHQRLGIDIRTQSRLPYVVRKLFFTQTTGVLECSQTTVLDVAFYQILEIPAEAILSEENLRLQYDFTELTVKLDDPLEYLEIGTRWMLIPLKPTIDFVVVNFGNYFYQRKVSSIMNNPYHYMHLGQEFGILRIQNLFRNYVAIGPLPNLTSINVSVETKEETKELYPLFVSNPVIEGCFHNYVTRCYNHIVEAGGKLQSMHLFVKENSRFTLDFSYNIQTKWAANECLVSSLGSYIAAYTNDFHRMRPYHRTVDDGDDKLHVPEITYLTRHFLRKEKCRGVDPTSVKWRAFPIPKNDANEETKWVRWTGAFRVTPSEATNKAAALERSQSSCDSRASGDDGAVIQDSRIEDIMNEHSYIPLPHIKKGYKSCTLVLGDNEHDYCKPPKIKQCRVDATSTECRQNEENSGGSPEDEIVPIEGPRLQLSNLAGYRQKLPSVIAKRRVSFPVDGCISKEKEGMMAKEESSTFKKMSIAIIPIPMKISSPSLSPPRMLIEECNSTCPESEEDLCPPLLTRFGGEEGQEKTTGNLVPMLSDSPLQPPPSLTDEDDSLSQFPPLVIDEYKIPSNIIVDDLSILHLSKSEDASEKPLSPSVFVPIKPVCSNTNEAVGECDFPSAAPRKKRRIKITPRRIDLVKPQPMSLGSGLLPKPNCDQL